MITTDVGAWNEMCARVRTVFTSSDVATLVGYEPELRYYDKVYKELPDARKVWGRISLAEAGEEKRTLSRPARVTQAGIVDIQVFVPVTAPRTGELLAKLGELVKLNAFSTSTGSVDFFRAAARSMGKEDQWFYKRVSATYKYDVYV